MPARLPIAVLMTTARQSVITGVADLAGRHLRVVVQTRQCHEGLDGRPHRILAAQGTIVERHIGRIVQRFPVLCIDTVDEKIGVITGLADVSQYFAIARVDSDQGTAIIAKRLHRDLLQLCIQGQRQVLAGLRRGA